MYTVIKPNYGDSDYVAIACAQGSCDCCGVTLAAIPQLIDKAFDQPVKGTLLIDNLASLGMSPNRFFVYRNYDSTISNRWDINKLQVLNPNKVQPQAIEQVTRLYCSNLLQFVQNSVLTKDQAAKLTELEQTYEKQRNLIN